MCTSMHTLSVGQLMYAYISISQEPASSYAVHDRTMYSSLQLADNAMLF